MLSHLLVIIYLRMYREMSYILPNLPCITNVMYVLAYWNNWYYGRKLKININIIFVEPMYLLLNYINYIWLTLYNSWNYTNCLFFTYYLFPILVTLLLCFIVNTKNVLSSRGISWENGVLHCHPYSVDIRKLILFTHAHTGRLPTMVTNTTW
jgi:hypothetical protein